VFVTESDGIRAVDVATGVESPPFAVPPGHDPEKLLIDPDGETFSSMPASDSTVAVVAIGVWEIVSGKQLGTLRIPGPKGSDGVDWTVGPRQRDGRRLIAVATRAEMALWDLASGVKVKSLGSGVRPPNRAYFSRDGSVVVSTGDNGRVVAWDVARGTVLRTVQIQPDRMPGIALSRDNSAMLVSADDTVSMWWLRSTRAPRRLVGKDYGHVAFTGDDSALVITARGGEVHVFERPLDPAARLVGGEPSRTLFGFLDVPDALGVSAVGRRIATLSGGTVHVWDLADTTFIRTRKLAIDTGIAVKAISPDARLFATQSDSSIALWDMVSGKRVGAAVALHYPDTVQAANDALVAIAGNGRFLVSPPVEISNRGPRDLFDATTGARARSLAVRPSTAMAFAALGSRVAHGIIGTRKVVVEDLAKPGVVDTLDPGPDPRAQVDTAFGLELAFSPRGNVLATQATQMTVLVWDVDKRQLRDSLTGMSLYQDRLRITDDGRTIAAANDNQGEVTFWHTGSHDPISRLRLTDVGRFDVAALSSNGQLYAIYKFNSVVLADVARGEVIGEIVIGNGTGGGIAFTDDDRTIVAINSAGRVMRIPVDPDAWLARACAIAGSPESLQRFSVDAPAGTTIPARCKLPAVKPAATP
jgi:WD40 repeat protein